MIGKKRGSSHDKSSDANSITKKKTQRTKTKIKRIKIKIKEIKKKKILGIIKLIIQKCYISNEILLYCKYCKVEYYSCRLKKMRMKIFYLQLGKNIIVLEQLIIQ